MDRYQQKLSAFRNVSSHKYLLATDDFSSTPFTLAALVLGYVIFVQRIEISVTTDNAATLTFKDTAGTPLIVAVTKASPGVGSTILFDFGPDGIPLTESKAFVLANSAAGLAAAIKVTAYQKPVGAVDILVLNTVGGGTPGTNHG